MNKKKTKLAIIIPAFKKDYLEITLESIKAQSCKDFTVYIGDDASPFELQYIVSKFKDDMDIRYHKFNENLGGHNLVEHWNRCIELVQSEEWIWLFSDDDIMEEDCVKCFYDNIDAAEKYNVVHFNLSFIDKNGIITKRCTPYPSILSSFGFFSLLYRGKIDARMPEFIFRKESLLKNGGFEMYPLAWRADNATVIKLAADTGIYTIEDNKSHVLWRLSESNISAKRNAEIINKKNKATIDFLNWVYRLSESSGRKLNINQIRYLRILVFSILIQNEKTAIREIWKNSMRFIYIDSIAKKFITAMIILYRIYIKHKL